MQREVRIRNNEREARGPESVPALSVLLAPAEHEETATEKIVSSPKCTHALSSIIVIVDDILTADFFLIECFYLISVQFPQFIALKRETILVIACYYILALHNERKLLQLSMSVVLYAEDDIGRRLPM